MVDEKTQHLHIDSSLPYELLALETALAAYTKELELNTADIENLAVACLERVTVEVCQ